MTDSVRLAKDRGTELLAKGKLKAALEQFERVLQVAPTDLTARQKLAETLVRLGRKADAVAQYRQACEGYVALGKSMQAVALCKVILNLEPTHTETQERLARLYGQVGRPSPVPQPAPAPAAAAEPPRPVAPPPPAPPAPAPAPSLPTTVRHVPSAPRPEAAPVEPFGLKPQAPPTLSPAVSAIDDAIDDALIEIDEADVPQVSAPSRPPTAPAIPLFSSLGPEEFVAVLNDAVDGVAFSAGDPLVTEGMPGDAMYVVVEGRVAVERLLDGSPVVVDEMGPQAVFGEVALVTDSPRLATVRAVTPGVALRFAREPMRPVLKKYPRVSEVLDGFARERLFANWLRASPLFRALDTPAKAELTRQFQAKATKPGEALVQAGQPNDGVYLLVRGRCAVRDPSGAAYPDLVEGDSFGEISVIRGVPATATVTATTFGIVLRLSKEDALRGPFSHPDVQPLVQRIIDERLQRTAELLRQAPAPA